MDARMHLSGTLAACLACPALAGARPALEPYVAPSKLYAMHKPAGWKVTDEARPDSFTISAGAPDGSAGVTFHWARVTPGGKPPTALDLLKRFADGERQRRPGVAFEQLLVSKDSARAAVTERYSQAGTAYQGRVFLDRGYMEAPNQPVGPSLSVMAFLRQAFAVMPGHWGGWLFVTFPSITEVVFADAARTRALVHLRIGYGGADASLEKKDGAWVLAKVAMTWVE